MHKYLLLAAALAAAAPATATVVDFEGVIPAYNYYSQGVRFHAATPGVPLFAGIGPNGTQGLAAFGGPSFIYSQLRADIYHPTDFVSIDLGDYNADDDLLQLFAYDAAWNLLGSDSLAIPASFTGMKTLSVSAAGIARVIFGGVDKYGNSSVYSDNFTFNRSTVPEPAAWTLLIAGFGMIGGALRRRQFAAA